jgi:hypothetical protein
MTRKPIHTLAAASTLGLALAATPANALVAVHESDNATMKLGFLLQPQLHLTQHGTTEDGFGIDPYIRRARILMYGRVGDNVNFFAETDNPNFGKNGDWTGRTFIQDAFVEFNLGAPLKIDVGMLLMPFAHQSFQSATSLLTMDYHGSMIKYSSGFIWRDAGIMFRGSLADDKLDYRLAITNGVENAYGSYMADDGTGTGNMIETLYADALNPSDLPRVAARVNFNVFDSEDGAGAAGFFYDGIYLAENDNGKLISSKKVLSFGAAVDYQGNAVYDADGDTTQWMGVAADAFWDLPMGDKKHSLNGQVDFFMYNMGEGHALNGKGIMGDLGYRVHRVQPLVTVEWFDWDESDTADWMSVYGGVNWWYMGHTANVKFQAGGTKVGEGDFGISAALQSQLAF